MKKTILALFLLTIAFSHTNSAQACDLCAIYSAIDTTEPTPNALRFGIAEQFTDYGKVQKEGHYVENTANQHMESSITQIYGAYDLNESVAFQLNLPYINRRYKRFENGVSEQGTEAGIGDMSMLLKYAPVRIKDSEEIYFLQLFAGLKLATGDSAQLNEEKDEDAGHEDADEHSDGEDSHDIHAHAGLRHGGVDHGDPNEVASAIHGHDLALGSGSYDFPVGLNLLVQNGSIFATGSLQYNFRTRGSYDYEYADDFLWDVGPAFYVALCHDYTISLRAKLSGERKGKDNINGELENDTGINSIYLGPEIIFTAGNWSGEIGWDPALDVDNSGFQAVADYKLHAAATYKF